LSNLSSNEMDGAVGTTKKLGKIKTALTKVR
jgi:hypothetical protein